MRHAGSTTSPEPGKPSPRWNRLWKPRQSTGRHAGLTASQALNPKRQPAMLVRSGPGSSLLYAPEFPGRKSPCRNAAQAHESENLDGNRIVFGFCIRLTRRLQSITHLMYNANSGADAATLHALRLTRHHSESSPTTNQNASGSHRGRFLLHP